MGFQISSAQPNVSTFQEPSSSSLDINTNGIGSTGGEMNPHSYESTLLKFQQADLQAKGATQQRTGNTMSGVGNGMVAVGSTMTAIAGLGSLGVVTLPVTIPLGIIGLITTGIGTALNLSGKAVSENGAESIAHASGAANETLNLLNEVDNYKSETTIADEDLGETV